ncbi:MAG: DUF3237 domain-containing protein [Pseudobutyrivibrio ruminis]|uniref:DUF3237 family protein n=1 Tax=Pseudobutyrivibrio ruminis TaxID=46206 RepID=UPI0026EAAE85|nr:DUF3237 family protein [Pseudobutyrivibrio ruminis]MBE5914652.1 DUF3237 domain-containing protein [Pseudobutyrivibrio ruminis]
MNRKEILTVNVKLTKFDEVKGQSGEALMIHFDGDATGEYFNGIILPGGVDTQREMKGSARVLSARYILEGKDFKGNACKIFVENNGSFDENGNIVTHPTILTDSIDLAFFETADITGTISDIPGGVQIHLWMDDSEEL